MKYRCPKIEWLLWKIQMELSSKSSKKLEKSKNTLKPFKAEEKYGISKMLEI